MRTETQDLHGQSESAILELVDGPKDSRFMMTAKTVARDRLFGRQATPVTQQNVKKVTQFRGIQDLEDMVQRFMVMSTQDEAGAAPEPESKESIRLAEKEKRAVDGMAETFVPPTAKKSPKLLRP